MNARSVLKIFLMGSVFPLLWTLLLVWKGVPLEASGEPEKYVRGALGFVEFGEYVSFRNGVWAPRLDHLPGYPLFLAGVFVVLGAKNYLAVAVIQSLFAGLTVVGIAFAARSIDVRWTWPAAILASVWPNLIIRSSNIMPETVFLFFLVWGLCAPMAFSF